MAYHGKDVSMDSVGAAEVGRVMQSRPLLERWEISVYSALFFSRIMLYSRATSQNN